MGKLIYKKSSKIVLQILQVVAAGILVYCLLNIGFWMEDNYSLREMARSYEETDLYFKQVDQIIENKIHGKDNSKLFETDGEFDKEKELDIQSYGTKSSSVQDMNTTYLLGDILRFSENGGRKELHTAIQDALDVQTATGREAGEILDEQSDSLETILPVTGISLSECSRWYSNPSDFVLEMYQKLDSGFIPDLILLDVYMPGADGHRVIKDLRDNERYGDIPVAFMTADNTPESVAKGFREGVSEYITKPINREIVEARINRVLHLSRLQKSLQHEVRLRTMADKERNQRVATVFEQIVNALANTITAKDAYTRGHSDRVAKYAVMIAENLQYDQEKLTYVRYAGMLHDIGMIGIPTSLVNKPEKLTEEEYATVKKHTNIGSDILKGITAVPDIAGGAKWHHERYDGTGYPDRLKAMDIPEIARILAVADAYDSMTSDRAFRSRMTQQQVMNELEKGIGKQFDPVFANIMLEIIKNDVDFELREK